MPTSPRGYRKSPLDHDPEAVVYARTNSELTQAAAAAELGMSAGHLSEIENGTRNANLAMQRKMARLYNCPVRILQRSIHADEQASA